LQEFAERDPQAQNGGHHNNGCRVPLGGIAAKAPRAQDGLLHDA
jgi:hypothetical protein